MAQIPLYVARLLGGRLRESLSRRHLENGAAAYKAEDYAAAARHWTRGAAIAEGLPRTMDRATCLANLGALHLTVDSPRKAEVVLLQAQELYRRAGRTHHSASCTVHLASAHRQTGDLDRAAAELVEAEAEFRALGDTMWVAECVRERGVIAQQRELLGEAWDLFATARSLFEEFNFEQAAADCTLSLARLELLAGQHSAAEEKAIRVRTTFDRLELALPAACAAELLAAIYARTERLPAAIDAMREARDIHFHLRLGVSCAKLDLKLGWLMLRDMVGPADHRERVRDVLGLWIPALVFLDHRHSQNSIGDLEPMSNTWVGTYVARAFALVDDVDDPRFVSALLERAQRDEHYPTVDGRGTAEDHSPLALFLEAATGIHLDLEGT